MLDLTTYSIAKVRALAEQINADPAKVYVPDVRHFFCGGIYAREMFIPKGGCIIGAVHLRDHIVTILGHLTIFSPDGLQTFEGYTTFESKAGAQRTLFAQEDSWITTYHTNPTGSTDVAAMEALNVTDDLDMVLLLNAGTTEH